MITELSEEQVGKFPEYVEKWVNIGLDTNDINVEKALVACKQMYDQAGLEFPEKYEVYDSPIDAISEMKIRYNIDVSPNDFVYGSQEASWLSFYDYMYREVGIEDCKPLLAHMEFSKHCGWALLYDELVVLTYKPIEIHFENDRTRVHCDHDYAIKYRDGFGVCMWHGLRIPDEWIMNKESITADVCLHWENVEQRRAACEIIGWASVLKLLNATVIDKDSDPEVGTLVEANLPDIGVERFLIALDPNVGKEVGLPVPSNVTTALEANSWTYGINKLEFKPGFRV